MKPAKKNLELYKGVTWRKQFQLWTGRKNASPLWDFTNWTANFVVTDPNTGGTLLALDTTNGITLGGTQGTITIFLSATDSATLPWNAGNYYLTITGPSNGDTLPLLHGRLTARNL